MYTMDVESNQFYMKKTQKRSPSKSLFYQEVIHLTIFHKELRRLIMLLYFNNFSERTNKRASKIYDLFLRYLCTKTKVRSISFCVDFLKLLFVIIRINSLFLHQDRYSKISFERTRTMTTFLFA